MQLPGPDLSCMAQCHGPRAQLVRLFWSLPIFGRKILWNFPKCQGPRANTWLVTRNHPSHHFSIGTIHCHLASLYATKWFWKINYLWKCSFSKLLNFNWGAWRPLTVHVLLQLTIFMTKQKSLRKIFDFYLLLNYCNRQCTVLPATWAQSLTKFEPKMQDFEHVLDLNCK